MQAVPPLVGLSVTLLAWARLPWEARKAVWAEDGALFLSQLANGHFLSTLFMPYMGYLQFWPRILTEFALRTGDIGFYADRIAFLSCLAVGLMGVGVFYWSEALTTSVPVRLALAAAPVLVPLAPLEVLGNAANLHWFLLWGSLWMLLWRPRTWSGAIGAAVLGATFALTEIQIAALTPLFLFNVRSAKARVVDAGIILGLLGQGVATLAAPRLSFDGGHLSAASTFIGYLVDGPFAVVVGDQTSGGSLLSSFGWTVAAVALVPFLFSTAYVLIRGIWIERVAVMALAGLSALVWVAAVWLNATAWLAQALDYARFTPPQFLGLFYLRYGFVPGLCLLGIAVVGAATAVRIRRSTGAPPTRSEKLRALDGLAVAVPVLLLIAAAVYFTPASTLRSGQAQWSGGVGVARSSCATLGTEYVEIPQAPSGWSTRLPCNILR